MKTITFSRKSKYRNKESESVKGFRFDSKGERECFEQLKLLELAGEIRDLQTQKTVYLTEARIRYVADFYYFDNSLLEYVWGEFKGFETATWRIKYRLWSYYGPGRLNIFKRSSSIKRIVLHEQLIPKLKTNPEGENNELA